MTRDPPKLGRFSPPALSNFIDTLVLGLSTWYIRGSLFSVKQCVSLIRLIGTRARDSRLSRTLGGSENEAKVVTAATCRRLYIYTWWTVLNREFTKDASFEIPQLS